MSQNQNLEILNALDELEKSKGISKEILLEALDTALVSAYKRHYGSSQNVSVSIDLQSGKIQVISRYLVVEDPQDPKAEVSLAEAKEKNVSLELGDYLEIEVTPKEFGRIAAQTAKQVVVQRIREAERGVIFEEFANCEGDIVGGQVHRFDQKSILVDLGKVEGMIPYQEQIPGELLNQGQRIKCYVVEVRKTNKGTMVMLSRTHPGLLKRLLELEVPEIATGVVEIKSIAREAGSRSKVAVSTKDENVDPIGACVGPKGIRIQAIVNELSGEKIDVIPYSDDPAKFVTNAISPAVAIGVKADVISKIAQVTVPDNQLSLAIGREGQNARLSAKVTGWKIDIKSESQVTSDVVSEFEIDF